MGELVLGCSGLNYPVCRQRWLDWFSIKVPETISHVKRLDVNKGAITYFEEFLDKISPLTSTKKLGAILFQLPPSFTVNGLDKLPTADGYDYAVEFRALLGEPKPHRRCSNIII